MFEKIKKRILGTQIEPAEEFDKREGFPAENEGREVNHEEFRKVLENQKSREVYARRKRIDDYGAVGDFYIRLADGSVIRCHDYYPPVENGEIKISNLSPVGPLDNLPYKQILYGMSLGDNFFFKCKYILKD